MRRLLDLYDAGAVPLGHVRCVALDECDKMLGLGFAPQLGRLADLLLRDPLPGRGTAAATVAEAIPDVPRKKRRRDAADRTQLVPSADPAALPAADAGDAPVAFQRPQVLLLSATGTEGAGAGGDTSEGGAGVPEEMQRWLSADAARLRVTGVSGAGISETVTQVRRCARHRHPHHAGTAPPSRPKCMAQPCAAQHVEAAA